MADVRAETTDGDFGGLRATRGVPDDDRPTAAGDLAPRSASWRRVTLVVLLVSYLGFYLTRSSVSAVQGPMVDDLAGRGLTEARLDRIVGVSLVVYAIGKLPAGLLADRVGGRSMLLVGMVGSVIATVLLGFAGGAAMVAVAIVANRMVQSTGWGAVVNTASRWYPHQRMGGVMGVLALSYLFGDAIAKWLIGLLLTWGFGWRTAVLAMAGLLAVIAGGAAWKLRGSPGAVGLPEPHPSPVALHQAPAAADRDDGWLAGALEVLRPYVRAPGFWLVCVLSVTLTVPRITITYKLPLILGGFSGVEPGTAAMLAAGFSLCGGLSVLLAGHLSDRLDRGRRGRIMTAMLLLATAVAVALLMVPPGVHVAITAAAFWLLGLCLLGPYAFLSGAISVDLGGKRGAATAAAIIDSTGYVATGGLLVFADGLVDAGLWGPLFRTLGGCMLASAVAGFLYWRFGERVLGPDHAPGVRPDDAPRSGETP